MARRRRRKTRAEEYQESLDAQSRAYQNFRPKLEALQTFVDAQVLVANAPSPRSPGRRFYANLSVFLAAFGPPDGASQDELRLHLAFVLRLEAAGALKPGAIQDVEATLRRAIDSNHEWD
jgi:hypothetical protein